VLRKELSRLSENTMIVFDTYAWIEYLNGTNKGRIVAKYVLSNEEIAISSLCLAEIKVKYEREEFDADSLVRFVSWRSIVADVTERIALLAAEQRRKHKLYLIDAVMYATASHFSAKLLTGDKHFQKLDNVEFLK